MKQNTEPTPAQIKQIIKKMRDPKRKPSVEKRLRREREEVRNKMIQDRCNLANDWLGIKNHDLSLQDRTEPTENK